MRRAEAQTALFVCDMPKHYVKEEVPFADNRIGNLLFDMNWNEGQVFQQDWMLEAPVFPKVLVISRSTCCSVILSGEESSKYT